MTAHDLELQIQRAYRETENSMGWRFLYSPADTLQAARVAFIGLNPGGSEVDDAHSQFAMKSGSAYRDESWAGCRPGESKLQKQVLSLFDMLGEKPERVLAGNLVPFRSPDWKSLKDPRSAVKFGQELWSSVLCRAQPSLVVTMGAQATKLVSYLLEVKSVERLGVGWGAVTACRGNFASGRFIGLPHLSRFGIMTRAQSASHLEALFAD